MAGKVAAQIVVGVPVYNGETYLRTTVEALLAQTRRDLAVIISDNASSDGTERIGRELATADPRVHYFRNETNLGVFRNYDRAFELADCRFFKWASCNDLCAPRFIEACASVLEQDPRVGLVYTRARLFTDDPAIAQDYPFNPELRDDDPVVRMRRLFVELHLNNPFNGLYRAEWLRQTGLNGEYLGSDIIVVAEMALRGHVALVPEPLFYRRMTPSAASASRDEAGFRSFFSGTSRNVHGTPTIDMSRSLFRAIEAAPLTPGQRLRAWGYMLRRLWWTKGDMLAESIAAALRRPQTSRA